MPISGGCFNVSQQADGKLVIVGNDRVGDVFYGTFARLLLTGAPDTTFGTGGLLDISNFDTPTRVAFTSSGQLVTGLTIQDPADGVQKSYVVELSGTLAGPWLSQTITFNALPDRAFGDFFTVSATASSGLSVVVRRERRLHRREQYRAAHRRRAAARSPRARRATPLTLRRRL